MSHKAFPAAAVFFMLLSLFTNLYAAEVSYTAIPDLSSRDPVFRQFMQNVEKAYMAEVQKKKIVPEIFTYTGKTGDTLMSIAARCNIPIETIVLLNGMSSPEQTVTDVEISIPTAAGLFISQKPASFLEELVSARFPDREDYVEVEINGRTFSFVPSERLSPTERAFFLDSKMHSPLPDGVLSSSYGMRVSPITGNDLFHKGIDLAAPEGTSVFACKSGEIIETGYNDTYGNYIILKHDNDLQSFYAHLSALEERETGSLVLTGSTIGYVGSTGLSTGPHLHFEIRQGGDSKNPVDFLTD